VNSQVTARGHSAIDIHRETLLRIAGISAYLQSLGALPPHPSTVWRWIAQGVGGRRLGTVRIGGRTYTSKEALARFVEAQP
jgi:hypothetical protein